jgi:hypothetical protein
MDIVMDIERYYVEKSILPTVWLEEIGAGSISSFVSTVILKRIQEKMTGTDQDNT